MANKDKVFLDYDKIADWFDEIRSRDLTYEKPYLDTVIAGLNPGDSILDVGCGMGEPIAKYLAMLGFQVTGIDGSQKLIDKAQQYVPEATFYAVDMREFKTTEKFHAVIAWHSLFHLPLSDQTVLFKIFQNALHPGGILLFTSGHQEEEVWGDNGGENLYHASFSPDHYKKLLVDHSFSLISLNLEDENGGNAAVWIARLNS